MTRCRICAANDRDALIEDAARAMWDTQRSANRDDEWRPWEEAGPYWQNVMRQFAGATVSVLAGELSFLEAKGAVGHRQITGQQGSS